MCGYYHHLMVCPMDIFSTVYGSLYVTVCGEFSPMESHVAASCGRCNPNCGVWLPLLCVPICRPPVLNQVYWFNGMIFIIITFFYYFYKLKQGGISRGIREWNSVRSGGDPFLQREQLHRHGKRRGQPGEWLQAHAC